jgi:hypothetical protein
MAGNNPSPPGCQHRLIRVTVFGARYFDLRCVDTKMISSGKQLREKE